MPKPVPSVMAEGVEHHVDPVRALIDALGFGAFKTTV